MSGGVGQFIFNLACVTAFIAAVVGVIRLRQRVGRLPGLPPVAGTGPGRRSSGEHDANPREIDDASDDDGDGGDGGEA